MHKPTDIMIKVTKRCNLHCQHCNIWVPASLPLRHGRVSQKEELSYNEWIRIITDLKEWLGSYTLSFSGGEPFMREDLVNIIRFCHENEIRTTVSTNATLLTPETITALSALDTLRLIISLDGNTPQTYDYLRGVTGTYQKVMDVLEQFKSPDRRCFVGIAMVLMGYNCDEILEIVKFACERKLADGFTFQALNHTFGIPYDKVWFDKSRLWPKGDIRDRLVNVIEKLITFKRQGVMIENSTEQLRKFQRYFINPVEDTPGRCTRGENNFIINSRGEVSLCWDMAPVAHFSKGPAQIWNSADAKKQRALIRRCRRTCKLLNCNFKISLWEQMRPHIDRLIGLAGIFLKRHNPSLYFKLKKITHNK